MKKKLTQKNTCDCILNVFPFLFGQHLTKSKLGSGTRKSTNTATTENKTNKINAFEKQIKNI